MSKNQMRQLIGMVIALVVCVVGYFTIDSYSQKQKEKAEEESSKAAEANETVVFELENIDDITGFSYVVDGTTITLLKNSDDTWICDNDTSINIDEYVVKSTILNSLERVSSNQIIESPEDIAQYGFDSPQNKIVIMKSDGSSRVFTLGAQNQIETDKYYMMVDGDDNVYVIDSAIPIAFSNTIEDLEEETTVAETSSR